MQSTIQPNAIIKLSELSSYTNGQKISVGPNFKCLDDIVGHPVIATTKSDANGINNGDIFIVTYKGVRAFFRKKIYQTLIINPESPGIPRAYEGVIADLVGTVPHNFK